MGSLRFEWDPGTARRNLAKHNVSFKEAMTAFSDETGLLLDDSEHSDREDRFILLGLSSTPRLLAVAHAYRYDDDVIRLISATEAIRAEATQYANRWVP